MKKSYEIRDTKNEFLETTRRLYRGATEIAKKLEQQQKCASSVVDIFTPEAAILGAKLKDYCERLIFKDPLGYAQKIEQLLWRRGFYDAVSIAKKFKKKNSWSCFEKSLLSSHLAAGIGFYNHLIFRLVLEYNLDIVGLIDFTYPLNNNNDDDDYIFNNNNNNVIEQTEEIKECIIRIVHRCLICLGDLARYKIEFDDNWNDIIAMRYYKVAISIYPNIGMPHNQLGTLAANKNSGIDAVYYYLRSTLCTEIFDGAENNLNKIISNNYHSGNEISPCQICAIKLLTLLQKWNSKTCTIHKINEASQNLLDAIETHLMIIKKPNKFNPMEISSIEELLEKFKNHNNNNDLTDDVVFKIVAICLMSMAKLQSKNSQHIIAFILSLLSKLIQLTILRLQESINQQFGNNEKLISKKNKNKSLLNKLRRPRKRQTSSDSDVSDDLNDILNCEISSEEEFNSDISESEKDYYNNQTSEENEISDDDDDEDNNDDDEDKIKSEKNDIVNNNKNDDDDDENRMIETTLMKKENVNASDYMEILSNEGLLESIKICFDWLRENGEILKLAFKGSQLLLDRIFILMNLINIDINKMKNLLSDSMLFFSKDKLFEFVEKVPLPEDIDLKGLNFLNTCHKNIDWNILRYLKMNHKEESLLRCLKIIDFGNYLCTIDEFNCKFDETKARYIVLDKPKQTTSIISTQQEEEEEKKSDSDFNSKGKLMRNMGELWLKAEVKALESQLKSKLISPYLVPDHHVLAKHTPLLKRLVYSKKFIIVIPSIVVSALDEIKKTSSHAREATRWLEGQLRKGSRFLRAQRPQEHLSLPYIKGPRPKDKDAWLFFQIIECCYYLSQQTKVGFLEGDAEPPVVTLLTGVVNNCRDGEKSSSSSFSPNGLAKSAGVNLEYIESFHNKWKTSSKSHA